MVTREEVIEALREEIDSWGGDYVHDQVAVPAQFLLDVLRLLEEDEHGADVGMA